MIQLKTNRLLLRDHRWEDLETHHQLLSDKVAMAYLPEIHTTTLEASRANLELAIQEINAPNRKCYFLRIEDLMTHGHIGEIGYTVLDFTPWGKVVELGYFLRREHWGKGYGTEAAERLVAFAFEENDVYRITTGCVKENVASEGIMKKLGMIKEGEQVQIQWHEGRLRDRVLYRLLKPEWLQQQRKTNFKE